MSTRLPRTHLLAALLGTVLLAPQALAADGDMTQGTVERIDAALGKVTIRHGPIDELRKPPATMVFAVIDPAMLESLEPGDEIEFVAVEEDGRFFVTEIRRAR